jgi:tetratricopeptide (TPR) repeat protein
VDDLLFALGLFHDAASLVDLGRNIDTSSNPPFWRGGGGDAIVPLELTAALEALTERIEANPADADARFKRGAVCQGLGHHTEAYADLGQCIRLQPENARAWLLLSESLAAMRLYEQAKRARQQALEIDPRVDG